jgi:hypothetical protein
MRELGAQWLVDICDGDTVLAAYRMAYLTNSAAGYAHPTPTASEVMSQHRRISAQLGLTTIERAVAIAHLERLGLLTLG